MKNNNLQLLSPTLEMSSLEISNLTGKSHFHVVRDIKKMLSSLDLGASKYGCTYLDLQKRTQTKYSLDKILTITLISGYDAKVRMNIIKRWQELENNQPKQDLLPDHKVDILVKQKELDILLKKQELSEAYNRLTGIEIKAEKLLSMRQVEDNYAYAYLSNSKNKNLHMVARNIIRVIDNPFSIYRKRGESLNKALESLERVSK